MTTTDGARTPTSSLSAGGAIAAIALAVLLSGCTPAAPPAEPTDPEIEVRDDLEAVFDSAGIDGTFVLYHPADGRLTVANLERAQTRFVPASTYKIPHTLIALETGAVADVDEVVPYGGQPQLFSAWERDMSLREAVPASSVPVFQEVARRVGPGRMQGWLDRLAYGNREMGRVQDRFWLDGPLAVSAVEQARFLADLAAGALPASAQAQAAARDVALLEEGDGYTLYGKTGWAFDVVSQVGWWVGWVEREDAIHAFALNLEMRSAEDVPLRIEVGREMLRRLGVLPAAP
jgi:beta-lactamase class D